MTGIVWQVDWVLVIASTSPPPFVILNELSLNLERSEDVVVRLLTTAFVWPESDEERRVLENSKTVY